MRTRRTFLLWSGAALLLGATESLYADYASEVQAQQPLAYWRFGENITVPAYDLATNLGSLGPVGNGFYYDAVTRSVEGAVAGDTGVAFSNPTLGTSYFGSMRVPNNPALNPSGAFTIEFWAKPSNNTAALLSPVNSMSFVTGRMGYLFYQNAATWQFRVGVSSSTTASVLNGGVITSNQWQHVVGVFTPTTLPAGTMTLYVDGVQVATGAGNYEPNADASFFVGSTSSPNRTFGGAVDEVAFFNGALSATQIAAHFAARTTNASGYAAQVLSDAPVGYWRLDEPAKLFPMAANAGTLATAEDGKYIGVTNIAGPSGSSFPGLGANNSAAAFDGTANSYVQATSFGVSGPLTVLAWVRPNTVSGDRAIAGENASYAFKLLDNELRFTTPGILDHNSTGAGVQTGVWQLVGVTFDPGVAGGAKFYMNGQAVGTPVDASRLNKGTTAFWIGKNQWAGQYFDGAMDEVAVFDKILSGGTIMSLYFAAIGSNAAPFIVSDPPVVKPAGTIYATTSFSITPDVAGALPMSYQWRFNGANLPGATTAVFSKSSAAAGDAGTYDVVITNAFGTVTSAAVTVAVDPAVPPTIDQQPASRSVYVGGRASFAVSVSGTQPLTYQWKLAGANLAGATNATLVITNATAGQAGAYTVGVTNVAGGRLSSVANLVVISPAADTYEQAAVAAGPVAYWRFGEAAGSTTAFDYAGGHDGVVHNNVTVGASGPTSPAFRGFEANNRAYAFDGTDAYVEGGSLGLGGPISVAAWVKPNALSGDRAVAGENTSWAFKLLDNELRFTTPGILDHNSSGASLVSGEWQHVAVTFQPGAANGAKFYVNGRFISSTTASALTKVNSLFWIGKNQWANQIFDGTMDEVVVYDKILSEDTIATMYALGTYGSTTAPLIISAPASQALAAGTSAALTVLAGGSLPLSYQWKKADAPIAGATTSKLSFAKTSYGDAGSYTVTVNNNVGSTNSAAATLTVLPQPTFANLTNDLVLHLRFDGSVSDSSGSANDAAPIGTLSYITGKVGQGIHIATTSGADYLVVNDTAQNLTFEDTNSFSVAFWLKYTARFNDQPIIGNAVNSTWQVGWVITEENGGIEFSLADTPSTGTYIGHPASGSPTIDNGAWHSVVCVVDRATQRAFIYVDGGMQTTWSIAGLGALNSFQPLTIGQDPTGSYGSATFDLDDLGIWRRALTGYDALSIYNAGQGSAQSFDVYGPVKVDIAVSGANLVIGWQTGTLESSDNISNANGWTAVTGANPPTFTTSVGTGNKYYRVRVR